MAAASVRLFGTLWTARFTRLNEGSGLNDHPIAAARARRVVVSRSSPRHARRSERGRSLRWWTWLLVFGIAACFTIPESGTDLRSHAMSNGGVGPTTPPRGSSYGSSDPRSSASQNPHQYVESPPVSLTTVPNPYAPPAWVYTGYGPRNLMGSYMGQELELGFTIIFGGFDGTTDLNTTWIDDGALGWGALQVGGSISPRSDFSAAYFPPLSGLVVFGGHATAGSPDGDTWVLNSCGDSLPPYCSGVYGWHQVNGPGPQARFHGSMAYDPLTNELLLFGGTNGKSDFGDTWIFGPTSWREIIPTTTPSPRSGAALAWDPAVGAFILFGGINITTGNTLGDTWAFAGGTWSLLHPAQIPHTRAYSSAVTYRGGILLAAGTDSKGDLFSDSWEFAAGSWTMLPLNIEFAGRYDAAMMTTSSGQAELFGGWANGTLGLGVYGSIFALDQLSLIVAPYVRMDVGEAVAVYADAAWGVGLLSFTWRFPNGSTQPGGIIHPDFAAPGRYPVDVSVTDAAGILNRTTIAIEVFPSLRVNPLTASAAAADVGQMFAFTEIASGGSGSNVYIWSGLPAGCAAANDSNISCTADAPENLSVSVRVVDSALTAGQSPSLLFNISNDLVIASFDAAPRTVFTGELILLNLTAEGGARPISYEYQGLPPGCLSQDSPSIRCHPSSTGLFTIKVTVTDSAGSRVSGMTNVTVTGLVLGLRPTEGYLLIGGIVALLAGGGGLAAVVWKRRKGQPRRSSTSQAHETPNAIARDPETHWSSTAIRT